LATLLSESKLFGYSHACCTTPLAMATSRFRRNR
jgi:hypothetical protein